MHTTEESISALNSALASGASGSLAPLENGRVKDDSGEISASMRFETAPGNGAQLTSAFLRNVNHEIRTPLNAIVGRAELLIEAIPADCRCHEIRHSVEAIVEASRQFEGNFRAHIDLAKLEAVTFGLAPATLTLSELIELQLFEVQPRAERKAIAVIYQNDDPEITVTIDEYCLAHALANLLDNAIKFTEHGRVMVRVYRRYDSTICVEVRDTGIGIGPCYL